MEAYEGTDFIEHRQMAKSLAKYVTCASTIRAYCLDSFGKAPTLDEIKGMMQRDGREQNRIRNARREMAEVEQEAKAEETKRLERAKMSEAELRRAAALAADTKPRRKDYITIAKTAETFTLVEQPASPKAIIAEIARYFHLTYQDVAGKSQTRLIARARQMAYLILNERGNSYSQIGRWLNRDHSTVMHGKEAMQNLLGREAQYANAYDALSGLIRRGRG